MFLKNNLVVCSVTTDYIVYQGTFKQKQKQPVRLEKGEANHIRIMINTS